MGSGLCHLRSRMGRRVETVELVVVVAVSVDVEEVGGRGYLLALRY